MDPTPAPTNIKKNPLDSIVCDEAESNSRFLKCKPCENFYIDSDQHTKCKGSGCNISMMITFKFKQCPMEKW
jgi:hypothetical protein